MDILGLTSVPDFDIRKRNSKSFDIKTLAQSVNTFFKKATTSKSIPITTIHQVKGMTFDSVLLILSENSIGQNISLNDMAVPEDLPNEKQRLIYVAMSRPSKLLCIGVPNDSTTEKLQTKFGKELIVL